MLFVHPAASVYLVLVVRLFSSVHFVINMQLAAIVPSILVVQLFILFSRLALGVHLISDCRYSSYFPILHAAHFLLISHLPININLVLIAQLFLNARLVYTLASWLLPDIPSWL